MVIELSFREPLPFFWVASPKSTWAPSPMVFWKIIFWKDFIPLIFRFNNYSTCRSSYWRHFCVSLQHCILCNRRRRRNHGQLNIESCHQLAINQRWKSLPTLNRRYSPSVWPPCSSPLPSSFSSMSPGYLTKPETFHWWIVIQTDQMTSILCRQPFYRHFYPGEEHIWKGFKIFSRWAWKSRILRRGSCAANHLAIPSRCLSWLLRHSQRLSQPLWTHCQVFLKSDYNTLNQAKQI